MFVNYFGLFQGDEEVYIPKIIKPETKKIIKKKSYELSLNYSDPFLGKRTIFKPSNKRNNSQLGTTAKRPQKTVKREVLKKPKVVYKGVVKNNKSQRKTGLVYIDGRSYLVERNKNYDRIKVVSFNEVSLSYSFEGSIIEIEK